jgi:hypothetical protein
MSAASAGGEPRQDEVAEALNSLRVSHHGYFFDGAGQLTTAASHPDLAWAMPLLVAVARGQRCLAHGEVLRAAHSFHEAASMLPRRLHRPVSADGFRRAPLLAPLDSSQSNRMDELVCVEVSRVLWREQSDVDHLRDQAAEMTPRDALIAACAELLSWTFFDPHHVADLAERSAGSNGSPIERTREAMCVRATWLRQLGQPRTGTVSPSVWRAVGGYDGLVAKALDRLGDLRVPSAWWDSERADELPPVRPGRLLVWNLARDLRGGRRAWVLAT